MDADLVALAEAQGVATWYEDWHRTRRDVSVDSVVGVLGLLGVDATTPRAIRTALAAARERDRRGLLPDTVVVRAGTARELPGRATVTLEDGDRRELTDRIPDDLPLGWHRLRTGDQEVTLVVVPTLDLLGQWHDVLAAAFDAPIGLVGGGYHDVQDLTVTTYDSAHLHMDRLGARFGLQNDSAN